MPAIRSVDMLILVGQGVCVFLGFLGLSLGTRHIAAAEVALFLLLETLLGPVWVFLGGFESPPPFTVYGGIIIVLAMAGNRLEVHANVPVIC